MGNTDQEILKQLQNEDTRNYGFNMLVRTYQEKLYWHIRKMVISHDDTDDLLQNTFIKVFKSIDKFRGDAQLYTWLYRIATNECLTFLAKKKKRSLFSVDDDQSALANTLESDAHFSGDDAQLLLQKAILSLPEKQRLVFNMKYYDEMKYEDIAEILDTSVGALKASYHHAVKKIEKFITDN